MISVDVYKETDFFNIDVDIYFEGGILIIKGESGAGKTTLLDCIAGLKNPDRALISVKEKVLYSSDDNINLPAKDRNIGYLFQGYALFPHMTVLENVLYGVKSRKMKDISFVEKVLHSFRIHHIKEKLPANISGGEKQRTALARAIVTKPSLLLLDEPFSALDKATKELIYKEFMKFKEEYSMDAILITHDENEAKLLGDRIVELKDGMIIN